MCISSTHLIFTCCLVHYFCGILLPNKHSSSLSQVTRMGSLVSGRGHGTTINTVTLLGLETEVVHMIIYIETERWAVKSSVLCLSQLPGRSLLLCTGTCRSICDHYSLQYILLHWYIQSESKLVRYWLMCAVTKVKYKVQLYWKPQAK